MVTRIAEEIAVDDVNNYYSKKKSATRRGNRTHSPGIPMIFQGQELLEDGFFNDTTPINWDVAKYGKFVKFL
jgi:1,4-alpha-glucan branching enzyme